MATYLLRVGLVDRPGALGAVASRIGAVRGDVTAVTIAERSSGTAIDEFVVELPDDDLVPLLVSEVEEVDGASVHAIHPVDVNRDRRADAYDAALSLVRARTPNAVLTSLAWHARRELDGAWAAVVDMETSMLVAHDGEVPPMTQIVASINDNIRGSRLARRVITFNGSHLAGIAHPGRDTGWVHLAAWDLVLGVGRTGWSFNTSEKARLALLAQLADARWLDLAERESRVAHPSRAI